MRKKRPSVGSLSMKSFPNKSAGSVFINPASGGGVAPSNVTAPVISGSTSLGSVLSTTNGTWSGVPATFSYTYQWKRNGSPIGGATASTYTTVVADSTANITCDVTADNGVAPTATAGSNTLTMANYTPANTVPPSVTGTAVVGQTLSTTNGTWTNSPSSFTYQWYRGATLISGATSSTYTLVQADAGNTSNIKCVVTATNSAGSVNADSNTIAQILDADYNAILSRATSLGYTLPNSNGIAKGNDFMINTLKLSGAFAKADVVYMFATDGANNLFTTINWKNPNNYQATLINSPTFTNKQGFSWAATSFINTNFNPATAGGNYSANNCSVLGWVFATPLTLGAVADGGNLRIRQSDNQFRINDNVVSTPAIGGTGLIGGSRTDSANKKTYVGGTVGANIAAASSALASSNLAIFNSNAGLGSGAISFYFAGAAIDSELSALNTGLTNYMSTL